MNFKQEKLKGNHKWSFHNPTVKFKTRKRTCKQPSHSHNTQMVDDQLQDEDRQSGIPIPEDERKSTTSGLGAWNSGEVPPLQ